MAIDTHVTLSITLLLASLTGVSLADAEDRADVELIPLFGDAPVAQRLDDLNRPVIALFWRADCGPCLVELSHLAALQSAAGADGIITIALDAPPTARAALDENEIGPHVAFAAVGDPAAILAAASGGSTRLPLSIALDSDGAVCARHVGLLGTDLVTAWTNACFK